MISHILTLQTQNRDTRSSATSPYWKLASRFLAIKSMRVRNVVIPNTFYNINSNNNVVIISEGGVDTSVSITPGFYSIDQIVSQLTSQLTAASTNVTTYTATYSVLTMKITITSSASMTFKWTTSSGAWPLGFVANTTGTSHASTNVVQLSTNNIYLYSKALNDGVWVSENGTSSYILSIPLSVSPMQVQEYRNDQDKPIPFYGTDRDFEQVDFELRDDRGNVLDLNGSNWQCTIEFQLK
jgi:hypothetical protein